MPLQFVEQVLEVDPFPPPHRDEFGHHRPIRIDRHVLDRAIRRVHRREVGAGRPRREDGARAPQRECYGAAMGAPETVMHALAEHADRAVAELSELVRIPGVSAEGFDPAELERSAQAVGVLLADVGLEHVEILRVEGAHPYVVGDWLHADPGAPTLLIYAHHDVQPPGRLDHWRTEPFEPTLGDDGRLYGRGVVDDKAGIVLHAAALRAWLESTGGLPVNVKLVIEGEEETGSDHLAAFLRAYRERLE